MQKSGWLRSCIEGLAWIVATAIIYIAAQYIVAFLYLFIQPHLPVDSVSSTVTMLIYRLAIYAVTIALLAGALWYRFGSVSLRDAALARLLSWKDLGLAVLGAVGYVILTMLALNIAGLFFGVNTGEVQDLGLSTRLYATDLLVAFIVLAVLTPVAEEVIFRGFLYGRLRALTKLWWLPAVIVSALFGLAHMQWNVGIDVFCMSMVACYLRERTDSIWAGIILHMAKNTVAFFVTFVFVAGAAG